MYTDVEGEYVSNEFSHHVASIGIAHRMTASYTPQQSCAVERMNRICLNMVQAMVIPKSALDELWTDASETGAYIQNRTTCQVLLQNSIPFQIWGGIKPHLKHVQVLGFQCCCHNRKEKAKKLETVEHQRCL